MEYLIAKAYEAQVLEVVLAVAGLVGMCALAVWIVRTVWPPKGGR